MEIVNPPEITSEIDDAAVLGGDLGFILGAVLRSYVKTADVAVEEIPGGGRGYQVISAAVHGAIDNQRDLARKLGVDRTVMTYLLDDLEKAGLVERRPDPADRRNRNVVATDKGTELCLATEKRLRLIEEHVLGSISKAEQATLRELLSRVACGVLAVDPMQDACTAVAELVADPPRTRSRKR